MPGQGEGLVGGEITPDRFVVNKYTGKMTYQSITPQEHKFVRASNSEGIVKVALDTPFEQPVLSKSNLKVSAFAHLYRCKHDQMTYN